MPNRSMVKILKRVVPELNLLAHQITLHMVKKALHSAQRNTFCWSSNNGTIFCRGNFFVRVVVVVVVVEVVLLIAAVVVVVVVIVVVRQLNKPL